MKRGMYEAKTAKKHNGKKLVSLLLVLVLLLGTVIGTTLAWLTATSNIVTNTFTFGNITISLAETKGTAVDNNEDNRTFKLTPGAKVAKDPKVTVNAGSEACWLFVKIEEQNNTYGDSKAKILEFTAANGWTAVPDQTNVYYRVQEAIEESGTAAEYYVLSGTADNEELKNGQVKVADGLTADDINGIQTGNEPELVITAYAIQSADLSDTNGAIDTTAGDNQASNASRAWALVSDSDSGN